VTEGTALPYRKIPVNKYKRKEEAEGHHQAITGVS
jgi:hypothetical protein